MSKKQTRISEDVLTKAKAIAAKRGLTDGRIVLEAVFRQYADMWAAQPTTVSSASTVETPS